MTILPHSPRFDSPHACHVAEEQAFLAKAFHVACYAIVLLVLALAALWLFALATSTAHGQTPPPAASVSVATADGPVNLAPLPPDAQAAIALAEKLHPGWPWGEIVQWGAVIVFASRCLLKYWPGMPDALAKVLDHTGSHLSAPGPFVTFPLNAAQKSALTDFVAAGRTPPGSPSDGIGPPGTALPGPDFRAAVNPQPLPGSTSSPQP